MIFDFIVPGSVVFKVASTANCFINLDHVKKWCSNQAQHNFPNWLIGKCGCVSKFTVFGEESLLNHILAGQSQGGKHDHSNSDAWCSELSLCLLLEQLDEAAHTDACDGDAQGEHLVTCELSVKKEEAHEPTGRGD